MVRRNKKKHCLSSRWGVGLSGVESWEMRHSILDVSWDVRMRGTDRLDRFLLTFVAFVPLAFHSWSGVQRIHAAMKILLTLTPGRVVLLLFISLPSSLVSKPPVPTLPLGLGSSHGL